MNDILRYPDVLIVPLNVFTFSAVVHIRMIGNKYMKLKENKSEYKKYSFDHEICFKPIRKKILLVQDESGLSNTG